MTEWKTPSGRRMVTADEVKPQPEQTDSTATEIAIALCVVMLVGTVCALVLRAAGVI